MNGGILTPEDVAQCRSISSAWREEMAQIIIAVAAEAGLSKAAILGRQRDPCADRARHIIMFVAHRRGVPERAIADALGRDRSSVNHGVRMEKERRAKLQEAAE